MFKNKSNTIIFFFCIVKLSLHLLADFNSGYQGDELLHIETGNHPAFGYMEFPPLIGWLAFIQNLFHSQSVFVHHIFSHIASLLILILIGKTTVELGGKSNAVFLVLLCIIIAPAFGRSQQLFQPVVFSQLCWMLSFYQLVRFSKSPENKYLLYLMLSLALGFLTKYDIVFFIAGLGSLLLFKRTHTVILSRSGFKYTLFFTLLIIPNLVWQYLHHFPVLDMFSRLYETQLEKLSVANVIKDLVISLNPLTAFFWLAGLVYMFNAKDKTLYRPVAFAICISIIFLAFSKSKAYYFFPAMVCLMIFGSIWFERKVLSFRRWILYPATALMLLSGCILLPFGLAVLPLNSFIQFAHLKKEDGRYQVHYQEYYSYTKAQKTLTAIKTVYDSLPATEKEHCLIWGKHYSQAGIVNLYRQQYGLPKAFSYHGSFYLWAPEGAMPETVIAFTNGEASINFFRSFFSTVVPVSKVYNPYADFDKDLWQTIYICKDPKQTFGGLKEEFRARVFE
ncbi:MAG: glycosyltransferase family 39 protein [Ferruginibacter sp.]